MQHKYLVAVRYSDYECDVQTFTNRKEAEEYYFDRLSNREVWFCTIPKQPKQKPLPPRRYCGVEWLPGHVCGRV